MRSAASQRHDGSIIDEEGCRALVWVDQVTDDGSLRQCLDLPAAAARQLAGALLAAADEADGWVTR